MHALGERVLEDGAQIAARVRELVPRVGANQVAALAVEARDAMKLRHAPLLLVREMARHASVCSQKTSWAHSRCCATFAT